MAKEVIYRKDYKAPDFLIDNVHLNFDLEEDNTIVKSKIEFKKNNKEAKDCVLFADDLIFISVSMNGELLSVDDYILSEKELIIKNAPDKFILEVENKIDPLANKKLEGLYCSSGNFCTQCEPEGFRRITYYPDRSDVMAKFTVRMVADKDKYPVLLSNGNLIEQGNLEDNRHFAIYEDPFRKPSYLFALVAGKLDSISDKFTTMTGKEVDLHIYCNPGDSEKCYHAMESLKKAMKWDEVRFGREYDLNIFNIVIVHDFNSGAMENKSLNIFNSSVALANPKTATDNNFTYIEKVIGHEYFHNWSGDRVTCQSWFELTLKEGFTVFRDSEFSADMQDRSTERIKDVITLRNAQFPEDDSPMTHPIRPDSYMEINNFYTATVYEKGAEIIRMMHTMLGEEKFRKGTDLYFSKFDGQAVTCDDFVNCMEEVSGIDLTQFKLWYSQSGTPEVKVKSHWNKEDRTYKLELSQETLPTSKQKEKTNLYIPVKMAILNHEGEEIDLILNGENLGKETVIILNEKEQSFVFENVHSQPTASLFRCFSAPVKIKTDFDIADYRFLMENDEDGFNRWDSSQKLAKHVIMNGIKDFDNFEVPEYMIKSFRKIMLNDNMDDDFKALMLRLPSEKEISGWCSVIDPDVIHAVREKIISELSIKLNHEFIDIYGKTTFSGEYDISHESIGRRALHNVCLSYLCANSNKGALMLAENQYFHSNNMTEQFSAMTNIINKDEKVDLVLNNFFETYKDNFLVVNKWFLAQATSSKDNALEKVKELKKHPNFDMNNPNKVRSLIGVFASMNPTNFHKKDGSGYKFIADCLIELNSINPHVAARIIDSLCAFKKYDKNRQDKMVSELRRIKDIEKISPNLLEKIDSALKTV
ncbi:MAG: aminopeptidase N [Alphaproteobacteria bacterium]|jgi:aminopeptidase N|nr:aminopeptidase N [Alphaproteobacteria bacterium]